MASTCAETQKRSECAGIPNIAPPPGLEHPSSSEFATAALLQRKAALQAEKALWDHANEVMRVQIECIKSSNRARQGSSDLSQDVHESSYAISEDASPLGESPVTQTSASKARNGRTAKATARFKSKDFVNIQTNVHKILAENEKARIAHIEAMSKLDSTAQSTKKKPARLCNVRLRKNSETEESATCKASEAPSASSDSTAEGCSPSLSAVSESSDAESKEDRSK